MSASTAADLTNLTLPIAPIKRKIVEDAHIAKRDFAITRTSAIGL